MEFTHCLKKALRRKCKSKNYRGKNEFSATEAVKVKVWGTFQAYDGIIVTLGQHSVPDHVHLQFRILNKKQKLRS